MKSIIALEEIEQFSSGLMGKNHEEGTEQRIGKTFEVAGIVPCVVVWCGVVLHCIALLFITLNPSLHPSISLGEKKNKDLHSSVLTHFGFEFTHTRDITIPGRSQISHCIVGDRWVFSNYLCCLILSQCFDLSTSVYLLACTYLHMYACIYIDKYFAWR